ncbi:hypothetical protein [Demequina soli]|uniref:hypothetical protein n=1 Tax=Demequina soli TaxID=1638987 RepID=UPI000B0A23CF|nr:hypothetical protein [Demequina soli]
MTSLLRLVVAALVAVFLGWSAVAPSDAAASPASTTVIHAYDDQHHSADWTHTTPERGPPAVYDHTMTTHHPDAPWSLGVSTCPHGPTPHATCRYDDLGRLAQIPHRSGGVIEARSVVVLRSDVAANTAGLEARANALQGVLDPIAQNSRTAAVLGTREGQTVLAGGGRDLSPLQRALVQEGEIVARAPGVHAEVTAVNGARSAGLTPQGIGVSRPICPACQGFLEESGATITSPTTAWWFGG